MEVTAEMVKTLRHQSGAGIMDCKNALKESNGDVEEAITYLRKRGVAKADKKGDRATGDGSVGTYIHAGNKIGVLVALNCETDFVANTDDFKSLLKDIAMHIAAAKPRFISRDAVTQDVMDKEREIFAHQARESGKPDNIINKIVEGKMSKNLAKRIAGEIDLEVRSTVLGHVQRGGTPNSFDRVFGTRLGTFAVHSAAKKRFGNMVALRSLELELVPLEQLAGRVRQVPLSSQLIRTAESIGICLGRPLAGDATG